MKGYLIMYEAYFTHLGCKVEHSVSIKNGVTIEHIELGEYDEEYTDGGGSDTGRGDHHNSGEYDRA